jgi:hypothetical protein
MKIRCLTIHSCPTVRSCLMLLVSMLLAASEPVSAQWSVAPADSARQDFRQRLLLALDLTPSQQDTLRLLREGLQLDLTALRVMVEDGDILAEEGRLRYSETIDAYRVTRDSVLTMTQLELLERARTHLRDQVLYDGQNKPEVSQRLVDALELNDLQRRRWLSLLARLREQVRELREVGDVVADDYGRLHEEYRFSFEAILTPEQRLELERIRLARERDQLALDETQFDLLDDMDADPDAPVEDAWESLESELGNDGAEP